MVNLKCINKGINVTWSWCYQNETLQWFWSKLLFLWKHIFWCISEYMKNSFEILKFPMGMEAWFSDLFLLSNRLALWVSLLQMFTPICIYGYNLEYHNCNSTFLWTYHAALYKCTNCSVSFPPSTIGIMYHIYTHWLL